MNKLIKRRQAREKAVQTLFQLINAPEYLTTDVALEFALEAGNDPQEGFTQVKETYVYDIIQGVLDNQEAIDQVITQYLSDWTLERIARIDLVILRVAFYELLFGNLTDVPEKVAVNEAIDLSKLFSDEKSRRFVSGVLLKYLNRDKKVSEDTV